MRWIEALLPLEGDDIDEACEKLGELGVEGMVVEDEADFTAFLENNRQYWDYVDRELQESMRGKSRIKFYVSDDGEGKKILARARESFGRDIKTAPVCDCDWENGWRQYYKPIEVGKTLLIVPEWESAPETERKVLRLDPGLIFGTGSHPSTMLCLCALEEYCPPGGRVLDLGCGSGILGIAALLLGAASVAGCDVDPKAPDVAAGNAALNGFDAGRFMMLAGDVLSGGGFDAGLGAGYDLAVANIVADVIIALAPKMRGPLRPGGIFICSGIIGGRGDETKAALNSAGFEILSRSEREDWLLFVCRLL